MSTAVGGDSVPVEVEVEFQQTLEAEAARFEEVLIMQFQQKEQTTQEAADDCTWVTIGGNHVCITSGHGEHVGWESHRARIASPLPNAATIDTLRPLDPTAQERAWAVRYGTSQPYYTQCYEQAARFLALDHPGDLPPEARLVHGVLGLTGIGHGWVELPGNVIFDGVVQRYFDKGDYYKALKVKVERRYTRNEAMRQLFKTRNFGPWHDTAGRVNLLPKRGRNK